VQVAVDSTSVKASVIAQVFLKTLQPVRVGVARHDVASSQLLRAADRFGFMRSK
jgi:hypothetical protein